MTHEATLRIFHDSFERCTRHGAFLDTFYLRFRTSTEEAASFLQHLCRDEQVLLLKLSLYMILDASSEDPEAFIRLDRLCEEHRVLPGRHWDLWLSTLLGTVAEFDDRYDAEIEAAWRLVLTAGLEHLQRQG